MNRRYIIEQTIWDEDNKRWATFAHRAFSGHVARLFFKMGAVVKTPDGAYIIPRVA